MTTPLSARLTGDDRGFALPVVLLAVAGLALLAVGVSRTSHERLRSVHVQAEAAKAEALADAGFEHAAAGLRSRLRDPLLRGRGEYYTVSLGDGEVEVSVTDEAGKIDLNYADGTLLTALLTGAGLEDKPARALADAIVDWADADDLRSLNGAEADDYRAAGLSHGPANRPFAIVDELSGVLGMPPGLPERLAPFLTVHSRRRGLDPTVAPMELLEVLSGGDRDSLSARLGWTKPVPELAEGMGLDPRLVVTSRREVFSIRAVGRTRAGAVFVREAAIRLLRDPRRPFAVLMWRSVAMAGSKADWVWPGQAK